MRFPPSPQQLQQLLDTESSLCQEAKAALEEALSCSHRIKQEAAAGKLQLKRELDNREEKIRCGNRPVA